MVNNTQLPSFDNELYMHIKRLPKIELHRHLLASIRLQTLLEMVNRRNKLENLNLSALEKMIRLRHPIGMKEFFKTRWKILNQVTKEITNFSRIVYEAIEDARMDNIKYIELRVSPYGLYEKRIFGLWDFFGEIEKGIKLAQKNFPSIIARIIVSIARHTLYGRNDYYLKKILETLINTCIVFRDIVVGFDLTGIEANYPCLRFKDFFNMAHDKDFFISIHAGETNGANEIRDAVEFLQADRIGHGIKAFGNREIMELLINQRIPLEICPTSNLLLGGIETIADHPIKGFFDAGAVVTINTDDPELFHDGITLTDEFYNVSKAFSFSIPTIKRIILNALSGVFIKGKERAGLEAYFHKIGWEGTK